MKALGLTARDLFNSRNGEKLKDSVGVVGILQGCGIEEKDDKKVCVVKIDDTIYAGTSSTIYEDCKMLIENFEEEIKEGSLKVSIGSKVSKGGRTFLNINLEE